MNPPKMPIHIGDYKRDTGHLRAAGHGAYLLLLFHHWSTGSLPDDDDQLSAIACMSPAEWKRVRPLIEKFFNREQSGVWIHGRVEKDLASANESYQKRAKAGAEGGKAKATAKQSSSNATARLQQPITLDQIPKTKEEKKEPRVPALDDWPENFGDLFWQDYPRRTEKLAAMKKLETVRKSGIVSWADLIAGVQRYARAEAGNEQKFTKHPTVWLNKGCWSDEIKTGGDHGNRNSNPRSTGHDAILAAATRKAERLAGDGELAGAGAAPEFSDRNGIDGGRSGGFAEANGRPCGADDGLEPRTVPVLEGEIIAPDKAVAGQRDGRLI